MPYFMSFILWQWKLPEAASTPEQVVWGNPNLCFWVRVTAFGSRINSLLFPLRWELFCIDKHIHFHSLNFSKANGAGKPRAGCPAYSRPSIMWSSPDLCFEQVQDPPSTISTESPHHPDLFTSQWTCESASTGDSGLPVQSLLLWL